MDYHQAFMRPDGSCQIPPGIYFGLPEEIYHADESLGSTSIKELAQKPIKWQYDRLRPRKDVEAEHLIWGRAWHCRVLEGVKAYQERYAAKPVPSDFPGCLATSEEIKNFLKFEGQKISGTKADLISRAKSIEGCPPIFDDLLDQWIASHPGHQELSPRMHQEIEDAVMLMERDPVLRSVMQAGSLIDGAAELSIFWLRNGVRCKCRLDYALAPTATRKNAIVIDLKSFTNYRGNSDEEAGRFKIYELAYDVQAAHYKNGIKAAVDLAKANAVFGDVPQNDNLFKFLTAKSFDWVWVMLRRDAGLVPVVQSVDLDDEFIVDADRTVEAAIDNLKKFTAEFGSDQLWSPPSKLPARLTKAAMPTYNRGFTHEQPID